MYRVVTAISHAVNYLFPGIWAAENGPALHTSDFPGLEPCLVRTSSMMRLCIQALIDIDAGGICFWLGNITGMSPSFAHTMLGSFTALVAEHSCLIRRFPNSSQGHASLYDVRQSVGTRD